MFLQNFNNWINEVWRFILFLLIVILILLFIIYAIFKLINWRKKKKFIKNNFNNENNTDDWFKQEISVFLESINFKIVSIKYVKNTPNKILAWKALIEILTRVLLNTLDAHGSEKGVLDSTYEMFKNIRNHMKENVGAIQTTKILLTFLNKTLRTFLAKWNKLINEEKVFSKENDNSLIYKKEFKIEYNKLTQEIKNKKYVEKLVHLCGIYIKFDDKYLNKSF